MALIHSNNLGLYVGVSRQAIDLRLPTHSEEMINCYPSLQYGVTRRNPAQKVGSSMLLSNNQFMHTYDRGLSGDSSEQYVMTIDKANALKVFDVQAGVYRTVTYNGDAQQYLESSNPEIGFSAITIKDVTFLANKDINPRLIGSTAITANKSIFTFGNGYSITAVSSFKIVNGTYKWGSTTYDTLAPARLRQYSGSGVTGYAVSSTGATIQFTIDGTVFNYTVSLKSNGQSVLPETLYETRTNIKNLILDKLGTGYQVDMLSGNKLEIYKMDGTAIVSTFGSLTFPATAETTPEAIRNSPTPTTTWTAIAQVNSGATPFAITSGSASRNWTTLSTYNKQAFIWISQVSVDTAFPYTFTITLKETNGTVIGTTTSSDTSTSGVASAFASWADATPAGFTAVASGSVCKITRDNGTAFEVLITDTYGDQASSAWIGTVTTMDDLPKKFPFKDTVVKVDGIDKNDDNAYWVKFDGNQWIEHRDPNIANVIDDTTMIHKITRNSDLTFTMSKVDWIDLNVGDTDSNPVPEFIGSSIKDLFFVNGRLGILTKNGISLSQQGVFSNFFRTTVLKLLDDSSITTYIDSSKSVGLEYASELQGSIILFGDKLQFQIDASRAITPSSISVQPISGYEINKNVKPISVGDSVFFLVSKNGYSSMYEMTKETLSSNINALDVSSHVPDYIDSDIVKMVASPRDNAVFLKSRANSTTIFMYKYMRDGGTYQQQSWSKWVFAVDIYSIFCFDKYLYIFGNRYDTTVPVEEYPLVGIWDDTKLWLDETVWYDNSVPSYPTMERIDIDPYGVEATFIDVTTVRYQSYIELSEWFLANSKSEKEIRGSLLVKTIDISAADNSSFSLVIDDKERGTSRSLASSYTVDRKPYIGGNSKNTRIKIVSTNGGGFQINSISLEGQYNVRSKKV